MADLADDEALRRSMYADIAVVLALFLGAGLLAGVLWPQLVEPVTVVRSDLGNATDEVGLAARISRDGWYSALAAVGGLGCGLVAMAWRRTHEVVTLSSVVAGSMMAALVSGWLGRALGPDNPDGVLAGASVGTSAPDVVQVYADAAYLVWPIAAVLGALVMLVSGPAGALYQRHDR